MYSIKENFLYIFIRKIYWKIKRKIYWKIKRKIRGVIQKGIDSIPLEFYTLKYIRRD